MQWMADWSTPYPIFVRSAQGAYVTDVDGHRYADFCLGDMGSAFGHANPEVAAAVGERARQGTSFLLPTEDSIWVAEELARRFKLPYWQIAMSATEANRFSLRLARDITQRQRIVVFNGCYHGTVDETLVFLRNRRVVPRQGNCGPPFDPTLGTDVVEFNDIEGLETVLSSREVACVLCEPAMTNVGTVLPEPGYHRALREVTRAYGTLLLIDEAHTICAGPAGGTGAFGLEPDIVTVGKPIGSGIPAAASGYGEALGEKIRARTTDPDMRLSGIGGTLSGNALSVCAMRAALEHVITDAAFARMIPLAERLERGIDEVIDRFRVPWHAVRLGARVEFRFRESPPRNGAEAMAGGDLELERFLHLYLINRGILLTPFQNILMVSPDTTEDDVDLHNRALAECIAEIAEP
jgi:glutamate-1-semialdehyde 2,1-aminomutase